MSSIASVSRSEIERRRSQLRHQRRWRLVQGVWRVMAMGGITAGVVWVTTLPIWFIHHPNQVRIEGQETLTQETIRSLLPLSYPEALVNIRPEAIATHLEAQAPIADAVVTRHLFPPGLVVQIRERYPVALLVSANTPDILPPLSMDAAASPALTAAASPPVELLDEKGFRMSYENYVTLNKGVALPELRVIGMQEQYRAHWAEMYQHLLQSPVKIFEVDWREPTNLILKTEMGTVHLGPYTPQLPHQLQILDQMRHVPEQLGDRPILYIDLVNPDAPLIELETHAAIGSDSASPAGLFENGADF
jgi:cell division protein FtsQ